MTTDYRLICAHPYAEFHRISMDWPWPMKFKPNEDRVICTLRLGTRAYGKQGRDRAGAKGRAVVKAIVLTEETLHDVMG